MKFKELYEELSDEHDILFGYVKDLGEVLSYVDSLGDYSWNKDIKSSVSSSIDIIASKIKKRYDMNDIEEMEKYIEKKREKYWAKAKKIRSYADPKVYGRELKAVSYLKELWGLL